MYGLYFKYLEKKSLSSLSFLLNNMYTFEMKGIENSFYKCANSFIILLRVASWIKVSEEFISIQIFEKNTA